jgi:hypothetical protein
MPDVNAGMELVMEKGKATLKRAAPGLAKGAGAIGVDVASDLLIDNIKDDTLRQTTRTAKDLALLYAAPIASLLSLEGSSKSREVQVNAVDKLVDMGDGTVVIRSSATAYDPKNPFDFRKWQVKFGDDTVETRMTIDEANALLKGKSNSPTIIEGSVVPIGFQSGKSLTKTQIQAGLQAEKEITAPAKPVEPSYLNETESVPPRPSEMPSVTESYTAPPAAERRAPAPSPLRELPQISISGGRATLPVPKPKPVLSEYEKRRRALGPNATKEERDAVRDFGLQEWAGNFPALAK